MNIGNRNDVTKTIIAQGVVLLSGFVLKRAFDFGYRKIKHQEPPKTLRSTSHTLTHIVGWSILTGAVAGIVRLVTRDFIYNDIDPHYIE